MKQEFIDFLDALMEASPEITKQYMTSNVEAYINILKENDSEKPILTDNGKVILRYLQENQQVATWKAKDIATGLEITSRGTSASLRKLVTDGFVEKLGKDPAIYTLTEKGKKFIIED